MFNLAAFNPIPAGPVGNCGVGILEGPGTATIAAGLSKTFHLTERLRMRFESTFTNLFNHRNFAAPPTKCDLFVVWRCAECAERRKQRKPDRATFLASRLLKARRSSFNQSGTGPGLT
jgi:hypothetical protein